VPRCPRPDHADRLEARELTAAIDLEPPARELIALAEGVTDDMLQAPTPCGDYTVADLLGHVMGLTIAFRDAGAKAGTPSQDAEPGRVTLEDGWRDQLPGRLLDMAAAWRAPQAREGLTKVGGGTMPATIAGQAGLNELVIHGWDLARGTGQPYRVDEASAQAAADFLSLASAGTQEPQEPQKPQGSEPGQRGPFGPAVDVPVGASVLDRAVGLSGRDPHWPGA
jgi:uncharacterized protein (TIGR03086 family)